jgi:ATP-binding cassette subfamily B protein
MSEVLNPGSLNPGPLNPGPLNPGPGSVTTSSENPGGEIAPGRFTPKDLARLFWRTWPYLKPHWKHIIGWLGLNFLVGGVVEVFTLVLFDLFNNGVLVGTALPPLQVSLLLLDPSYATGEALSDDQRLVVLGRIFIVAAAMAAFFILVGAVWIQYYKVWLLQRINQGLRVTMIERAEHLSLRYHSHARTGDAIYRVTQDSSMITNIVENLMLTPIQQGGGVLWGLLIVFLFSPTLGFMCLAIGVPVFALLAWYTPRLQRRAWRARQSNSDLTSRIQEVFAGIRVVKANQAEGLMNQRFDVDSRRALENAFQLRKSMVVLVVLVGSLFASTVVVMEYLMARWTVEGSATWMGAAIALVGFAIWNLGAFQTASERGKFLFGELGAFVYIWTMAQDMAMGLERAFYLLDLKPDVEDTDDPLPMPTPIEEVVFSDVHFGYEPERPILKGVNLTAYAGTVTAIVAGTGAGKSTLMSMLLRLYDPDKGTITINDTPLPEIGINNVRRSAAIALQQNVLFTATIADNIAYAAGDPSRDEIENAARIACAHDFVSAMPDGYDTELGERGGKLSTGQRQRLSIARALVRDTPILILDEPTSALDAETEQQLLANLAQWGRSRIVFLITHRISTIRKADQIAFLEDGQIREFGDHETLMAIDQGRYRNFVVEETQGVEGQERSDV